MEINDKIPQGNPFKVPENYFKELNGRIIGVTTGGGHGKNQISIRLRMRQYLAIAASIAVLTILSYTGIKLFTHRSESFTLNNIPAEVYSDELLNNIDIVVLEENSIASDIPEDALHLNDQDIIDYLVRENIDINDIYEKL